MHSGLSRQTSRTNERGGKEQFSFHKFDFIFERLDCRSSGQTNGFLRCYINRVKIASAQILQGQISSN
jgi:hypothetical protein